MGLGKNLIKYHIQTEEVTTYWTSEELDYKEALQLYKQTKKDLNKNVWLIKRINRDNTTDKTIFMRLLE